MRLTALVLSCLVLFACGPKDAPERIAIRERLTQDTYLTHEEIERTLDEVARSLEGKTVRVQSGGTLHDMDEPMKDVVLGMIAARAGVFDEGVRISDGTTLRVLNAPGKPSNAELDAARHIYIDIETFLPRHFEFTSGVSSDEFKADLVVEP